MKWISTKERLPEEYGEILFVGDGVTKHGEYSSYRGEFGSWESGYHRVEEVEWWMPLPTPPSEEESLAENKLSLYQLKQIREAIKIIDGKCLRDSGLLDEAMFCNIKCLDCWGKFAENELEKRGAGK